MSHSHRKIRYQNKSYNVLKIIEVAGNKYSVIKILRHDRCLVVFDPHGGPYGALRIIQIIDPIDMKKVSTIKRMRSSPGRNLPTIVRFEKDRRRSSRGFLVLSYTEGKTLDELIQRNGIESIASAMHVQQVLSIYRKLAHCVSQIHSHGLVHGDIAPGNLVRLHKPSRLELIDFGEAWTVERTNPDAKKSGSTPPYAAPERELEGQLDMRSDYYSATAVFYELITGYPPYDGLAGMVGMSDQVKLKRLSACARRPDDLSGSLWQMLDSVVEKNLSIDPHVRSKNSKEWLDDLDELNFAIEKKNRGKIAGSGVFSTVARFVVDVRETLRS